MLYWLRTGIGKREGRREAEGERDHGKLSWGSSLHIGVVCGILKQNWEHGGKGTIWGKKMPLDLDI